MNNQTKSTKRILFSKKKRFSDDKNAVAIVKIVPQLGCVSQDSENIGFSKRKTVPGKPMQKVLGSMRQVRFTQSTPRQTSTWEKKGPSLGKIQVKPSQQRSPYAVKLQDRSQEGTEREQRYARGKASNLAKNMFKFQEKDKATFHSPAEEMDTKRVCSGFRSNYAEWSTRKTLILETMRIFRSPTTVMTANGGANKRRSHGMCQRIVLICQSYAS